MEIRSSPCCGMREIDGLSRSTAKDSLEIFASHFPQIRDITFTHVIFSGITSEKYGQRFADLIEEHELGVVVESPSSRNPNSGNNIKAWIWTINRKKMSEFLTAYQKKRSRFNGR